MLTKTQKQATIILRLITQERISHICCNIEDNSVEAIMYFKNLTEYGPFKEYKIRRNLPMATWNKNVYWIRIPDELKALV